MEKVASLNYDYGDDTMVHNIRRYEIIEVLTKLHAYVERSDILLVGPGIIIGDARYNYTWKGTIFEFHLGNVSTRSKRYYVGYIADPDFEHKSNLNITFTQFHHKK